ncbi:hypothetical protein FB567DRAFT_526091 [Paraphoma chrysanthemicola]|uniref:Uncharacterized protein n=1 Tax=Paraphoma chrysanthemicola TaxID=798071 RepID=A0A8K0R756_9PLEO|nr:hypothetical protein FB567DRAFT_526091 [Paraphoma chrysanthemicola]
MEMSLSRTSMIWWFTACDPRHTRSPVKQDILWISSLEGMERPVRSFKSFIRTAPPNPGAHDHDKPLPPTPTSPTDAQSKTRAPFDRSGSITSWRPPAEWDDPSTMHPEPQSPHIFSTRIYAPLLPEPSPGVFDMLEPMPWPYSVAVTQHSPLEPIEEKDSPSLPPRHPSRTLRFQKPPADSDTGLATSTKVKSPLTPLTVDTLKSCSKPPVAMHSDPSLRGKMPNALNHHNPILEDHPENTELGENLEKLSISQDYHNVLADQYHESHVHTSHDPIQMDKSRKAAGERHDPLAKNHEMVPRPLSWKKDCDGSSHGSAEIRRLESDIHTSDRKKRHRKFSSWVPMHQLAHAHKQLRLDHDESPRSASEPSVPSRKRIFGSNDSRSPREFHLTDFVPKVKGFRPKGKRARTTRNRAIGSGSPSIPFQPTPPRTNSSLEQPMPLLRLPGGLAIVRQVTTPTPQSQPTSFLNISPEEDPRSNSPDDFPGFEMCTPERPLSSLYSQGSHSPVAPGRAINRRLRTSFGSPDSPQSPSGTPSPPTSPLAHEIELPRTPPPPPNLSRVPNSPPPSFLLSTSTQPWRRHKRTDSATGEDFVHKRVMHAGIFDKARDARDAWKRHQKDVKHEKLKASIRIVGPTDPFNTPGV